MPYTPEQKAQFDKQCYGMSEQEALEDLTEQSQFSGKEMLLYSMLSDVQALMELNRLEQARQLVNRVKLVISDVPENKMDDYLKKQKAECK